ncbi:MAG: hypothetical protein R3C59_23470 [Planctomycetaceae bacterium]
MSRPLLTIAMLLVSSALATAQPTNDNRSSVIEQRIVGPAELARFRNEHDYQPISRDELARLLSYRKSKDPSAGSAIQQATYSAYLEGTVLTRGTIALKMDTSSTDRTRPEITSLGASSLQNIQLFAADQKLELATNSQGDLISLGDPSSETITGTWTADGEAVGQSIVFQLKLPVAAVCEFTIYTDPDIVINSSNALVVRKAGPGPQTQWVLYPQTPTGLTISCTSRSESLRNENIGLMMKADYRFRRFGGSVTWSLGVPQSLTDAALQFSLDPGCSVRSVTLSNGTSLDWTTPADSDTGLQIRVPPAQAGLNLSIEADMSGMAGAKIVVPFLVPGTWQPETAESGGPLSIRSSDLRLTVAPEIVVTAVEVDGVAENDVQYGSDGSQILNLVQFSQNAAVTLLTTPSSSVIDDSVVVQEFSDDGKADAFASVLVRAGFVGTLRWNVPTSWRVTDVLELGTRSPLLFHISETPDDPSSSLLEVTLRTPLMAGGLQNLLIRLQSTGGQLTVESPVLLNSGYHRQHDFVVPIGESNDLLKQAGVASTGIKALEKLLPWLPAGDLSGTAAYRRADVSTVSSPVLTTSDGMVAAVDYSVTADRNTVQEFLRLNLRGRSELPTRIPLRVTSGVDLQLAEDSPSQPSPVLRRESSGRRADEWILELPAGTDNRFELDVLLTAVRPLLSALPVTMLEIPQARHDGGIIQPPAADASILMTMGDDKPLSAPQQYPARPLDLTARLLPDAAGAAPQIVSGNAFLLLDTVNDSLQVKARYRLLVRSPKAAAQLVLQCDAVESLLVFIDERQVFAEQIKNRFRVPLSERREDSKVDIFLTSRLIDSDTDHHTYRIPTVAFPEAGSARIASFLLTPPGHVCTADTSPALTSVTSTDAVTRLLGQQHTPLPSESSVNDVFASEQQQFMTLWKLNAARSGAASLVASQQATGFVALHLYHTRYDASIRIVAGLVMALLWLWLLPRSIATWWLAAVSLLVIAAWQSGLTPFWRPILSGTVYGTTIAGLLCLLQTLRPRRRQAVLNVRSQMLLLPAVVMLLSAGHCCGAPQTSHPTILIPEGPLPVVYVDQAWLNETRQAAAPRAPDALVVTEQVDVVFRSAESAVATITCDVATAPDKVSGLHLPLTGVTLVGCLLDGERVFPTRHSSGETMILIPPQAVVPASPMDATAPAVQSSGPRTIGSSLLRTVQYTVRVVPQSAPGTYRITVPFPPSPQTRLNLQDPDQLLSSAWLSGADAEDRSPAAESFSLPTLFNQRSVDVNVELKDADATPLNQQRAEVTCRADVWPAKTRLVSEYRVIPADARATEVQVGRSRRYRVISVKSATGQNLPWAVRDDQFSIQIAPDTAGVQHFRIELETETPISLRQQIAVGRLATVNGIRTAQFKLQPNTSELFFVSSVTADGQTLEQLAAAASATADATRNPDPGHWVPPIVNRIDVALERRPATREARLVQKATVHDTEIEWLCRCEIDISGQPVFRQILHVSPDVRISDISARNGEVARLQSWTRNGNSVIVSLREATRGSLVLNVKGTVPRLPGSETRLPVIGLPPSVDFLGSTLEIASGSESDIFISDLAGNVPDSPMAIQTTPIPRNPVRMTVIDDQRPLVIQANPDKRILATTVVVIYEADGRPLLAQFLSLKTPDAAFTAPFSLPNTAAFATCRTWIGTDGTFNRVDVGRGQAVARVAPESEPPVVVAVTDIVAAKDNEVLTVAIPNFDADFRMESFQAFDLRSSATANALPAWLQEAIRQTPDIAAISTASPVEASYNSTRHQGQVRLPTSSQTPDAGSPRGGVAFSRAEHTLHLGDRVLLTGSSGFLTFSLHDNVAAKISVPSGTIVTDVSLNGMARPAVVDRGTMTIPTADRVSCIELTWVRAINPANDASVATVPVPGILCPQTSTSTRITHGSLRHWTVLGNAMDPAIVSDDRLRAITTGLQLIDSDTLSDDATVEAVLPDNLQTLPPSPIWQQLDRESAAATAAFGQLLLQSNADELSPVDIQMNSTGDIRLKATSVPRLLTGLSVLSALMLFITPLVSDTRRPILTDVEASTVVTTPASGTVPSRPSSEPSTVASIETPDSAI